MNANVSHVILLLFGLRKQPKRLWQVEIVILGSNNSAKWAREKP